MGRAIVRNPSVFLMDEPLSNLDARLRVQMRAEVARVQRELGVTTIYVTHDQVEAMTMGDRVAVMRGGVLQQTGEPQSVFDRPANLFVASFIGSPPMNLVQADLQAAGDGIVARVGNQLLDVPAEVVAERSDLRTHVGRTVGLGIRPEHMHAAHDGDNARLRAVVQTTEALGSELLVHVEVGGARAHGGGPRGRRRCRRRSAAATRVGGRGAPHRARGAIPDAGEADGRRADRGRHRFEAAALLRSRHRTSDPRLTSASSSRSVSGDDGTRGASVLTVGETMALLDPLEDGVPRLGTPLALRFGGAESNFAVALSRLGIGVRWVSRLGRDPFGDMIEDSLAREGVDLRWVRRDDAPTGVFWKWRVDGRTSVGYRRAGSAAARLAIGDVPDEAFDGVRLVHLTGITMAISETARELVLDVARHAKERGALVVFDPNFRPALPDTPEAAAERQRAVLPYVDWYLCGEGEAALLWPDSAIPVPCVVRVGERGAIVDGVEVPPPRTTSVVDEVGAGDAFAAGFAYGLLNGFAPKRCAHAGNVIAAWALAGTGDWETLPWLEEVRADLTAA